VLLDEQSGLAAVARPYFSPSKVAYLGLGTQVAAVLAFVGVLVDDGEGRHFTPCARPFGSATVQPVPLQRPPRSGLIYSLKSAAAIAALLAYWAIWTDV